MNTPVYLIACVSFFLSANVSYSQPDSVDVFLKSQMTRRGIPGLQLAIIKNGAIVKSASYGFANVQDSILVDSNTVFPINSMTKAFVGVSVMQLVDQAKLALSAPVSEYLDSLPLEWRPVTVKQLLTHTSGIPDIIDSNGNMISKEGDNESWLKVQALPMNFKPGDQFSYNQTNYLLLGNIINKVSGKHFTEFIADHQLLKVGMKNTARAGFTDSNDVIFHSARGYAYSPNGRLSNVFEQFSPFIRTAAGMNSTAKEMALWLIALQNGRLLQNENSLSTLWTPAKLTNGQTGGFSDLLNGYALGWPIVEREEHPAITSVGGGRSALFQYPRDNLAIVILTNLRGSSPESFIDEVAGFYIPDMKESRGFGFSPSVKLLRSELDEKGYQHAIQIADKFKTQRKGFELKESELNRWGYKLRELERVENAVEIFKLNVYLFPKSANVYDSLGEAYAAIGKTSLAILNYERSLKLDPQNGNAAEQLKKLKSK